MQVLATIHNHLYCSFMALSQAICLQTRAARTFVKQTHPKTIVLQFRVWTSAFLVASLNRQHEQQCDSFIAGNCRLLEAGNQMITLEAATLSPDLPKAVDNFWRSMLQDSH